MLQDSPEAVKRNVPPKTPDEKRLSAVSGTLFVLFLFALPTLSTLALSRPGRSSRAKAGILLGSLVAGTSGWLLLRSSTSTDPEAP